MAEASPPPGISKIETMASPRYGPSRRTTYDVVIVGGAVIGSSVAYWLTRNPAFDGSVLVVVLAFSINAHHEGCTSTAHTLHAGP